jgi:hypothetical protein
LEDVGLGNELMQALIGHDRKHLALTTYSQGSSWEMLNEAVQSVTFKDRELKAIVKQAAEG